MRALFCWGNLNNFLSSGDVFKSASVLTQDAHNSSFSRIDLHEADGVGHMEYYSDDHLRVLIFDCAFRETRTFEVKDGDWIRLNFSLDLAVDMAFGSTLNVQEWRPSWRLIRVPQNDLVVEVMPADTRLQWVTICCKADRLRHLAGVDADDLPFMTSSGGVSDDAVVYRPFPLTAAMKSVTTNLIGGLRPRGALSNAYIALRANELLVLALDHLLNDHNIETLQVRLSERDVEALHAARSIIERNLMTPPSVKALSHQVGINRNKLFYGFKSLFGVSVSEHLQNARLETALRLLISTNDAISDVAANVGFRHQCNFSTAFKARYGLSPLNVRSRRRLRKEEAGERLQKQPGGSPIMVPAAGATSVSPPTP